MSATRSWLRVGPLPGRLASAGWQIPSLVTLVQMVADAGFSEVELLTTYRLTARGESDGPWRAVVRAS